MAGVNVYVVVAVLFSAGNHVPVILLFEVVGNGDKVVPEQILARHRLLDKNSVDFLQMGQTLFI